MDYSTISNKTNITEIEELSNNELNERYYSLKKQYDNLSANFESTRQELHDTKRNYQTALDAQEHLNMELEALQTEVEKRRADLTSRLTALQEEIASLRQERLDISERHTTEIASLKSEIRHLKEENSIKDTIKPTECDSAELEEAHKAIAVALADAASAKKALELAHNEIQTWQLRAETLSSEMLEMREAAEIRREELRAANDREAVALAELAEARAFLHQCTDPQDPQPHAAKGNSLFAEVDDKRQEMAKNLVQMKQSNSKLRRELANKQAEVDALLHEKHTIWEEQLGAAAHYDRELIESYEDRITQLQELTECQRREWARWFEKHCDPTANGWLSGVLHHLKEECEKLRDDVLARGAAQLANAALIRELRRKLASTTTPAKPTTNVPVDAAKVKERSATPELEKLPVPVKIAAPRLTPDDVKKRVTFN